MYKDLTQKKNLSYKRFHQATVTNIMMGWWENVNNKLVEHFHKNIVKIKVIKQHDIKRSVIIKYYFLILLTGNV